MKLQCEPCAMITSKNETDNSPFRIKVTSKEIADLLLSTKDFLTTREVANELRKRHPHRIIVVNDIYKRLVEFVNSPNAHCVVDTSTRPRRFRLYNIYPVYFVELRRQLMRKGAPIEELQCIPSVAPDEEKSRSVKEILALWDMLVSNRNSIKRM